MLLCEQLVQNSHQTMEDAMSQETLAKLNAMFSKKKIRAETSHSNLEAIEGVCDCVREHKKYPGQFEMVLKSVEKADSLDFDIEIMPTETKLLELDENGKISGVDDTPTLTEVSGFFFTAENITSRSVTGKILGPLGGTRVVKLV